MAGLRIPLLLVGALVSLSCLKGQGPSDSMESKQLKLSCDLQFGMLAGGQLVNDKIIYESGIIGQAGLNAEISPWIQAGVGFGIQSLDEETILPVFLDIKARLREGERSSFVGLNIGGTSAWSSSYRNVSEFEYEGGFYFSPYCAFQFPLSEEVGFLIAVGLIHQLGEIEFLTEFNEEYEEEFAMDFLTIRGGIRF